MAQQWRRSCGKLCCPSTMLVPIWTSVDMLFEIYGLGPTLRDMNVMEFELSRIQMSFKCHGQCSARPSFASLMIRVRSIWPIDYNWNPFCMRGSWILLGACWRFRIRPSRLQHISDEQCANTWAACNRRLRCSRKLIGRNNTKPFLAVLTASKGFSLPDYLQLMGISDRSLSHLRCFIFF